MRYGMALTPPIADILEEAVKNEMGVIQTFSFDTKLYPQEWLDNFKLGLQENNVDLVIHAPLMMNLISRTPRTRMFSLNSLSIEMYKCYKLGSETLVIHPGSLNVSDKVVELSCSLHDFIKKQQDKGYPIIKNLAVETMCGAGSQAMLSPEDYKQLFDLVDLPNLCVCLDTAHSYGAGYTPLMFVEGLLNYNLLDRLRVIHFNNTHSDLNSKKERHSLLNEGKIGINDYKAFLDFLKVNMSVESWGQLYILEEPPKDTNISAEIGELKKILFN